MDSVLPAEKQRQTKKDSDVVNMSLKPGHTSRRTHDHTPKHENTKMLHRKLDCGPKEIDIMLHGPSFNLINHQPAMHSCPELSCRNDHSCRSTPTSRNIPHHHNHFSQPSTPTGLLSRFDRQLHRAYPWESPLGSSRSISSTSLAESVDDSTSQAGRDRRRRARDSEIKRGNSSADNSVPIMSAPAAQKGTRQLVVAGVVLGVLDLDRLSLMARIDGDKSKQKIKD